MTALNINETWLSPSDNDEVVSCINFMEFVVRQYFRPTKWRAISTLSPKASFRKNTHDMIDLILKTGPDTRLF